MNFEERQASKLLDAVSQGVGNYSATQIRRALWVLGDLCGH